MLFFEPILDHVCWVQENSVAFLLIPLTRSKVSTNWRIKSFRSSKTVLFLSTPRIQLRRRMQGTRTFPNPRWTLPGSDPTAELPAGAEERIREVGDVSRIYIVIYIISIISKLFIFYLCHFGPLYFAPFHCKLQQFFYAVASVLTFSCQPENI